MLFDSTLRRELARSFGGTLVVILTIVMTMMLIRTLGQAAGGAVAPQDVVLLLGYTALGHLPTMLALSLFIAVVVTLGRMYRDSEMAIWFASGVPLTRFVRPVLRMGWPVLLVVALLVLFVWPWGNQQQRRAARPLRAALGPVARGARACSRPRATASACSSSSATARTQPTRATSSSCRNNGAREAVTSARGGHLDTVDGERWLVLERGQRNEADSANGDKTLSQLRELPRAGRRARAAASRRAAAQGDAHDRPAAPADAAQPGRAGLAPRPAAAARPTCCCWAIGLAATNPRRASNWNLLFALLAFVVYYNLINLSRPGSPAARFGMGAALVTLHGGAFAAGAWRCSGGATMRRCCN